MCPSDIMDRGRLTDLNMSSVKTTWHDTNGVDGALRSMIVYVL